MGTASQKHGGGRTWGGPAQDVLESQTSFTSTLGPNMTLRCWLWEVLSYRACLASGILLEPIEMYSLNKESTSSSLPQKLFLLSGRGPGSQPLFRASGSPRIIKEMRRH